MADAQFKINITGDATSATNAAGQARNALGQFQATTKEMGEEAKKAGIAGAEGAKESLFSHAQLSQMVKGLRHEFPELYHVAHMALHPVTLATAGLVSAWELWQKRIEECEEILGGKLDLPAGTAMEPGHVTALAEEWEKYGAALGKAFAEMRSIETTTKHALDNIAAALARQKELMAAEAALNAARDKVAESAAAAAGTPQSPAQRLASLKREAGPAGGPKAAEQAAAAEKIHQEEMEQEQLEYEAMIKREVASKIPITSKEEDEKTLRKLEQQAEKAQEDRENAEKKANALSMYINGEGGIATAWAALGPQLTGMSATEALKAEEDRIANDRSIELRYYMRQKAQAQRAKAQEERARLFSEAAADESKAATLNEQLPDERKNLNADIKAGGMVAIMAQMTKALEALNAGQQKLDEERKTAAGQVEHFGSISPVLQQAIRSQTEFNRLVQNWLQELQAQLQNMRHP
jgi:hypothetical protein